MWKVWFDYNVPRGDMLFKLDLQWMLRINNMLTHVHSVWSGCSQLLIGVRLEFGCHLAPWLHIRAGGFPGPCSPRLQSGSVGRRSMCVWFSVLFWSLGIFSSRMLERTVGWWARLLMGGFILVYTGKTNKLLIKLKWIIWHEILGRSVPCVPLAGRINQN